MSSTVAPSVLILSLSLIAVVSGCTRGHSSTQPEALPREIKQLIAAAEKDPGRAAEGEIIRAAFQLPGPEGVAALRAAVRRIPGSPDLLSASAEAEWCSGSEDGALSHAQEALKASPGFPWASWVAGVILLKRGQQQEAWDLLLRAAEVGGEWRYGDAMSLLFATARRSGREGELAEKLGQLYGRSPSDPGIAELHAQALLLVGRYTEAARIARPLLDHGGSIPAANAVAFAHLEEGNTGRAAEWGAAVVDRYPLIPHPWLMAAVLYAGRHDFQDALRCTRWAAKMTRQDPAHLRSGSAHQIVYPTSTDLLQALLTSVAAIEPDGRTREAYWMLRGFVGYCRGDWASAQEAFGKAKDPSGASVAPATIYDGVGSLDQWIDEGTPPALANLRRR